MRNVYWNIGNTSRLLGYKNVLRKKREKERASERERERESEEAIARIANFSSLCNHTSSA